MYDRKIFPILTASGEVPSRQALNVLATRPNKTSVLKYLFIDRLNERTKKEALRKMS